MRFSFLMVLMKMDYKAFVQTLDRKYTLERKVRPAPPAEKRILVHAAERLDAIVHAHPEFDAFLDRYIAGQR